jgi:uncharacterized protein
LAVSVNITRNELRTGIAKSISLLILQPTPFCNIDCKYCYLPGRNVRSFMKEDDLRRILTQLREDGVLGDRIDICWHAGEPLVAGVDFYSKACELIQTELSAHTHVTQIIQTNGILINERWCQFFREHDIHVGISIDGPQATHDKRRLTRAGAGTFDKVVQAIKLLQRYEIDHYALCVVNEETILEPDRLNSFFANLGFREVCYNIEETDGINQSAVLGMPDVERRARHFFRTLLEYCRQPANQLWIRELHRMLGRLATASASADNEIPSDLTEPLRTLTVAYNGDWSTFSPEFAGITHPESGNFVFGNLVRESLFDGLQRANFLRVWSQIQAGVNRCRATCPYFRVCGGGAPSNKFAELEDLAGSETVYCRTWTQALADACLDVLENVSGSESAEVGSNGG